MHKIFTMSLILQGEQGHDLSRLLSAQPHTPHIHQDWPQGQTHILTFGAIAWPAKKCM